MKIASILVAAAGVGLTGYALQAHFGARDADAVVVTLPQRAPEPAAVREPAARPQKATSVPGDRASLTRELQRELQRVGCYSGEISGVWTTSSRMAMKSFTDRVNASLPIETPDYILLSLVQRHEGRACGAGCPTGQSLSEEGRCVPSAVLGAVLAKAATKPAETKPADAKATETKPASTSGYSTTAGVAPERRSPAIRGSAALVAPEAGPESTPSLKAPAQSEQRPRIAASRPEAQPLPDPDERPTRRTARADEPQSDAEDYDERPRRKVRRANSKPPKIVRKFLRSMQRSFAGLPW